MAARHHPREEYDGPINFLTPEAVWRQISRAHLLLLNELLGEYSEARTWDYTRRYPWARLHLATYWARRASRPLRDAYWASACVSRCIRGREPSRGCDWCGTLINEPYLGCSNCWLIPLCAECDSRGSLCRSCHGLHELILPGTDPNLRRNTSIRLRTTSGA